MGIKNKGKDKVGFWVGVLDPEVRVKSSCDSGPDANSILGYELEEQGEVLVIVDQFREGQCCRLG